MKSTLALTFVFAKITLLLSNLHSIQGFVYPESPVGDTVWNPDTAVTISWSDDKQTPSLSTKPVFDIFLMTGADDHQTKLATIATNVKGGTTKSISYLVPHVSPPGKIYFLMFVTKDGKSTAWATRFTITDESGNPGTLKPVIPAGGKVNPGGVGSIISAPVPKADTPITIAAVGNGAGDAGAAAGGVESDTTKSHSHGSDDGDLSSIAVSVNSANKNGGHSKDIAVQNGGHSIAESMMHSLSATIACVTVAMGFVALMAF
ncbi:hypothetical protein BGX28_002377 [Mortierella sp. GBA30]|nr:hypothetical protein BGX28_002377 [Mortierella sp. GBA30]